MAGMLTLGKPHLGDRRVTIDAPFYQAGLAGYSDAAMRLIARRHGCPFCITEAMLDVFLLNGGKGLAAAQIDDADHPITGQLMGSHPVDIAAGAKVLVSLGYDVVDVNLACPVKKIKKKARGGHLLSAPDDAIDIWTAVVDTFSLGDEPHPRIANVLGPLAQQLTDRGRNDEARRTLAHLARVEPPDPHRD